MTPSSTDIGRITINAPNQSVQPRLLVGSNTLKEPTASQRLNVAGARDVESIFSGTGKVRMQVWVKRDILSGGVDTHEVVRIDVDRDILGPISHRPVLSGTPTLGRIEVMGNIDPVSGGIVAFGGDIGTINTVSGSLFSDVIAVNGDIEFIEIGGSLTGNMVFDGDGTSSLNDDIFILGDLGAGEGLTGQIIIKALNEPNWFGWHPDAYVTVGATTLAPEPYYNNRAQDIGGGAVGEVPYYLHYADSQPSGTKVNEGPDGHENGLSECALFPHHIFLLSG